MAKARRSRASTPEAARKYRAQGHEDATLFALMIGLEKDYENDKKAKKDVIDPSGDAHSVKAGQKKWQIFLYGRNRFITDDGFQALNGIGQLLIHCIDAFPPRYEDYRKRGYGQRSTQGAHARLEGQVSTQGTVEGFPKQVDIQRRGSRLLDGAGRRKVSCF